MTEEGLAYWVALFLLILSLLASKPSRYFGVQVSQVLAYAAMGFLLYGFLTYLAPVIKRASESLLIKGLWAGLTIAGATFSISLAQLAVNEALQVPTSGFPHTQTLVAVLVAPVVIGVFVVALGLLLSPIFQIMLYSESGDLSLKSFLSPKPPAAQKKSGEAKYIARFLAFFLVVGLCFAGLARSNAYLDGVGNFIRWFAFHFETERHSRCSLGQEARVAYLSSDQVVLAQKDGESYRFQVVACRGAANNALQSTPQSGATELSR